MVYWVGCSSMAWETGVQSNHTKDFKKMLLDISLLNTQHYKVRIKVKSSNPGKGVSPLLHLSVVAIEKGAFGLPTLLIYIYIYICAHAHSHNHTHIYTYYKNEITQRGNNTICRLYQGL